MLTIAWLALGFLLAGNRRESLAVLLQGPMAARVFRLSHYAGIDLLPMQEPQDRSVSSRLPDSRQRAYLWPGIALLVMLVAWSISRRRTSHGVKSV